MQKNLLLESIKAYEKTIEDLKLQMKNIEK
jgi:hypothetical protein